MIKLCRVKNRGVSADYQTAPIAHTGIGRFQVYKTDNANARVLGSRPKWTVFDLYGGIQARAELDTLTEVREWIEKRLSLRLAGEPQLI